MRRGSLARRYRIVLVALVTGALVAAGAIQLRSSYVENQAALVALQREKAVGAAGRIEAFVRDIERQLSWTTHAPLLTTDAALDLRQLDAIRLQRQAPPITELTYIDASGREQLFVSRLIPDRRRSGLDLSPEPRFREARGGRAWFGPVYFRKESEPYMTIAAPLAGGGVVAADVNLKFILDVVSQIKVGRTGLAFAVDGGGALIAHPDISLVLQKTSLGHLPQVAAALTPSPDDDLTIARDLKGTEVLTANSRIPSLGWVVFVEQPVAEAFAPVRASAYRVIAVVLAGIVLSIVASVVLARRLARPIQTLQESAARIGRGELDHRITLRTGDELEALADEFNQMTGRLRESYATLEQKVEDRTRELSESLEQQTATAEILRVISSSPTTVEPIFDAIVRSAQRLCGGKFSSLFRFDGGLVHYVVTTEPAPEVEAEMRRLFPRPADTSFIIGRAIVERTVMNVADMETDPRANPSIGPAAARIRHFRAMLVVPMLREGQPIGVLTVARAESGAFADKDIALMKTFADQAVIAIENVRLFKELEARNAALTKALDQQTATSDILRVISQSQTDVQPVFETIVQSAVRLSGASHGGAYRFDGELVHRITSYGYTPEQLELWRRTWPRRLTAQSAACEAIRTGDVARIRDIEAPEVPLTEETRAALRAVGTRSVLAVPMLRQGEVIGSISLAHPAVDGFTDAHVELLKTFADQAVIAVQNVRLFTELEARNAALTEALDQQTATAEILRVISGSPTDIEPVLESVVESAARLCEALDVSVFRVEGSRMRLAIHRGPLDAAEVGSYTIAIDPGSVNGQAVLERRTVHVSDLQTETDRYPTGSARARQLGWHTTLTAPLLRENTAIGVIVLRRAEIRSFTDKQIALLETFADQAVIAIENVRLFKELEARNALLSESLEQQTATGEILRVISSSPTDVQPVLDVVAENAARVCGATDAIIVRAEGEFMRRVAHFGALPLVLPEVRPITRQTISGRAMLDGTAIHVADVTEPGVVDEYPEHTATATGALWRTHLTVPLMRKGTSIGAITIRRSEVRPFSDKQVALLQTFADQAVIAIENVRLFTELESRNAALTESLEQQTATAAVLRAISGSPTDVQPVFDAILANAVRICGAVYGMIWRFDGQIVDLAGLHNWPADEGDAVRRRFPRRLEECGELLEMVVGGRTVLEIADVDRSPGVPDEVRERWRRRGVRSVVMVPMTREAEVLGAIGVSHPQRAAFSASRVELLKTFADQAVIAIENVRLFKELEAKNAALAETLEQQTATGEILRSISSSPTDVQPVFEAIVRSAWRLLQGRTAMLLQVVGDELHLAALTAAGEAADAAVRATFPVPVTSAGLNREVIQTRRPYVVADIEMDPLVTDDLRRTAPMRGFRSMVLMPMLREDRAIGVIIVTRQAPGGFSQDEVDLLKTFSDQAVIAIENVRLFTELQARTADLTRSVGELEALGEVGRAISSTLDLDRVLETIVSRANALAGTDGGAIYEFDEATRAFHLRATDRFADEFVAGLRATPLVYGEGAVGRAAAERQPVQIGDVAAAGAYESRVRDLLLRSGYRSLLAVPLLSEDEVVGALVVNRRVPGEFPPRTIELLRTFATQSAVAIVNARLFREIEDKSRELEAANRHKDEFLASMSHELRTPLNAVIGFSEVLLDRMFGDVNPKQEEYLNDILASGRHLLSLINDILDLAKIEAGRMEIDVEEFDLAAAIDNALVLIRERATRKGLALDTRLASGLGGVRGDQRKIKQVLVNLLSNAVKFTPEGGRIEVRAERVDGHVEVSVADTGIGIAPEDHEAVFEEFRQVGTDYAKKHEGTGLGLALSRKFVELHGGRIWLKSRPGEGSTFTFTIPVA